MSDHLLAISIGPVQGFIAAARKTRDLWYGSQFLSEVSRAVAETIRDGCGDGARLIFPSAAALARDAAGQPLTPVPNKLVVALHGRDPAAISALAERTARRFLERRREELFRKLDQQRVPAGAVAVDLLRAQVADFLEYYSAWVPFDPADPKSYADQRKAADHLLDGRKAIRDFGAPPGDWLWRDGRPKSALDPSRESVIEPFPERDGQPDKRNDELARALKTKRGEHLDGISLIKRLDEPRRFVSTARVAIDPFIRRLKGTPVLDRLNDLAARLKDSPAVESFERMASSGHLTHYADFPYDTQLFYGRLEKDEWGLLDSKEQAEANEFIRVAGGIPGVGDPPAYYAILIADGDGMGELIGKLDTPDRHVALSDALARFAQAAEDTVADHRGALIYSGGDDVLAFLPLDRSLDCADALRRQFAASVREGTGMAATLSVGVAIVHYSEPLGEALGWARDAEKAAKKAGPLRKNALAVALHTRAGGADDTTVVHNWGAGMDKDNKTVGPVAAYWRRWIAAHREGEVPDGAAYELRRLADEFASLRPRLDREAELLESETRRILAKKRGGRGLDKATVDLMVGRLTLAEAEQTDKPSERGTIEYDASRLLRRLADEIVIARRLARAAEIADGRGVVDTTGEAAT